MSANFEEAIQPLLDAYGALEADVAEKEAELADLRDKRNRLKGAVRALAPERVPGGTTPKKKNEPRFSQGSYEYVSKFLFDNVHGEFGSTSLVSQPGYEGVGVSTLPAILRALHQAGVIRLVRQGKGSSRYYEVIR